MTKGLIIDIPPTERVSTPGARRTPEQREHDMAVIARLYLQGKTLQQMGQAVGISAEQARYDLNKVRDMWLESTLQNFDQARAKALARVDLLEAEAWEAWEASKVQRIRDKEGKIVEERPQPGNIAYWNAALAASQERNKLLSLYGAEKIDATIRTASVSIVRDVSALSDAEIAQQIAQLSRMTNALDTVGAPLLALESTPDTDDQEPLESDQHLTQ